MKDSGGALWTIEQLREAAAGALEKGYDGPPNGRVRDVPDQRTIRYYTTLGLIDRALEMRGRTAYYGPRHLLQLVAIKKLQAKGQALAEVQRNLAGQTDEALRAWRGSTRGTCRRRPDVRGPAGALSGRNCRWRRPSWWTKRLKPARRRSTNFNRKCCKASRWLRMSRCYSRRRDRSRVTTSKRFARPRFL